ncbi:uncharacterized protein LOC131930214 [Physella acuta]|uniref:uncharacterized protein LOC131930214 n=1 Tax=Physella acuta TaxID=109671 RepID=UPI0027DDCD71|nr:uncharacterized protein LOC131930214 [Physella acuta]
MTESTTTRDQVKMSSQEEDISNIKPPPVNESPTDWNHNKYPTERSQVESTESSPGQEDAVTDDASITVTVSKQPNNKLNLNISNKPLSPTDLTANRPNSGPTQYEADVTYDPEIELQEYSDNCRKNPCHDQFVPVKDFSIDKLPEQFRKKCMVKFIKAMAFLTVRITTFNVSLRRPETHKGSPYPGYKDRGENKMCVRYGTGRVHSIIKQTEEGDKKCPCESCKNSKSHHKTWGLITVYTAAHVVFDTDEAEQAMFRWGYDSDEVRSWVDFSGLGANSDIDGDTSKVTCITHDVELIDKLLNMTHRYRICREKVIKELQAGSELVKLVVLVSHPHGCPKHISIGEWTEQMSEIKQTHTQVCQLEVGDLNYDLENDYNEDCDHYDDYNQEDVDGYNFEDFDDRDDDYYQEDFDDRDDVYYQEVLYDLNDDQGNIEDPNDDYAYQDVDYPNIDCVQADLEDPNDDYNHADLEDPDDDYNHAVLEDPNYDNNQADFEDPDDDYNQADLEDPNDNYNQADFEDPDEDYNQADLEDPDNDYNQADFEDPDEDYNHEEFDDREDDDYVKYYTIVNSETLIKYKFNACTCPGSSGATVFINGSHDLSCDFPHSGGNTDSNYTGYAFPKE